MTTTKRRYCPVCGHRKPGRSAKEARNANIRRSDKTVSELAREYGISKSRVSRIRNKPQ